ncbi:MAG: sigma-70 family RNA polymerase sigma factor [Acidimicrobiia bacterium]|nr:sigma-70 family RNA polymerase sigma factor [Acidimicrobiia bacterium]
MDDDELLAGCRAGDAAVWEELVRRYERLVRSIPRAYGLGTTDIEEIAQMTFSVLVQSLDRLRPDSRLAPWLSTVARRHTWRLLEARRREPVMDIDDRVAGSVDNVAVSAGQAADVTWVRDGLRLLPSRCRVLLEALYLAGERSYADIANDLGIPIGSIGPTRARCLERLRTILLHATKEVPSDSIRTT